MNKVQLLKMLYGGCITNEVNEVVCVRNVIQLGGEYTMCGTAWVDSDLENFGAECIDAFVGSLKDCTCPQCLAIINYCKSLK